MAANEGVPDELVGFLDGIENGDGIREVAEGGERAKLDELALAERGVAEAGFDELGVDLSKGKETLAFGEKVKRGMGFEELVWRVGRGWEVQSGW